MVHLLDLPYEVLSSILKLAEPTSLATLLQCCKDMKRIIGENPLLFKEIYLSTWVWFHSIYLN